ncbi:pyridoxine 5'-phosphate synthase [Candidatus Phycosocius spiralis]|uniref:Pyridoxine 5'-phosphate synthase n=1 Tax=Candidatus Phycosocius spiralis TaxID=2815099 RepID=A0ABQ4PSF8_9PROT|nr:pyridoxine 5'-phosphate synthase [Candidatus Phycosocius spiralis]GIU65859.1 pyridoxine 5'-phosphate synthase [Candidatus Phycosocius spiralis]
MKAGSYQRLGVNIDHVATIRNARGGSHPDPLRAAFMAAQAGADGITLHLREDRRHIRDEDLEGLIARVSLPINLELAATEEMVEIALRHKTHAVCIVPEKREERTTEGGLDVARLHHSIAPLVQTLSAAGRRVSLFVEPDPIQLAVAEAMGAHVVELHTGAYAEAALNGDKQLADYLAVQLADAARLGTKRGLEIHAGHGLTFENVKPIAAIHEVVELNIGHFLIGEAIFTGLDGAIKRMRALMDEARS